jgi:uncharacterized glyoxalase superfamily protein PhnB
MSQTVIPQLRITDAERSLSFYVGGLGFKVDWAHRVQDAGLTLSEFGQRGIKPNNPLTATPWGTTEFMLTDPDGNRLRFASELEAQQGMV